MYRIMIRQKFILLLCLGLILLSCTTTSRSRKKRRAPKRSRSKIEKNYKYKRKSPLGRKYPKYEPLHQNGPYSDPQRSSKNIRIQKTKKFVLIAPFTDKTDKIFEGLGDEATKALSEKFKDSKHIVLEDSNKFYSVIQQAKPGLSRNDDLAISKVLEKNMKLSTLITGVIHNIDISSSGNNIGLFKETKYICTVNMEIRAIDMVNQKLIYEEAISGTADKSISHFFSIEHNKDYKKSVIKAAIDNAFERAAWQLLTKIEKIGWKGQIAKVDREHIYINGGLKTGLSISDILIVSTLGDIIFNPETGKPIGRAPGSIKGTIRIVDFFGEDGAICVINSGAGFKTGDFVELQ